MLLKIVRPEDITGHARVNGSLPMLLVAFVALLTSCAWVKPTDDGSRVRVLAADQVGACKNVGTTHVTVLDNIGVIKRAEARVADELATLAANSAAQLGGNVVVPISEIDNGTQSFAIYQCD